MFLPLGFGFYPRAIPFAILAIAAVCLVWSYNFFPVIKEVDKKAEAARGMTHEQLKDLTKNVIAKACFSKFPGNELCREVEKKKGAKSDKAIGTDPKKTLSDTYEILAYIGKFDSDPKLWPVEARNTDEYKKLVAEIQSQKDSYHRIAAEAGMTSSTRASLFNMIRASFTHEGLMHLYGNLLFLVIFGLWVEQRAGFAFTVATFLIGSIFGLGTQMIVMIGTPVLGASAGISALMGAFFVFFRRADFNFVFMVPPLYFRKISTPLLWVFPFLYAGSDLVGATTQASSVAHLAHLIGLLTGLAMAFYVQFLFPLPEGALFPQESEPYGDLGRAKEPVQAWDAFKKLMRWNLQNTVAITLFLQKARALRLDFNDPKNRTLLEKTLNFCVTRVLKRGSIPDAIQIIGLIPAVMQRERFLTGAPISQLLLIADRSAREGQYHVALPVYQRAQTLTQNEQQKALIGNAIQAIHRKQQDQLEMQRRTAS